MLLFLFIDILLIVDTKWLQTCCLGQNTGLNKLKLDSLIIVILDERGHIKADIKVLHSMGISYDVRCPADKLIKVLCKVYPHTLKHTQAHRHRRYLERRLPELHRYTHIGQYLRYIPLHEIHRSHLLSLATYHLIIHGKG